MRKVCLPPLLARTQSCLPMIEDALQRPRAVNVGRHLLFLGARRLGVREHKGKRPKRPTAAGVKLQHRRNVLIARKLGAWTVLVADAKEDVLPGRRGVKAKRKVLVNTKHVPAAVVALRSKGDKMLLDGVKDTSLGHVHLIRGGALHGQTITHTPHGCIKVLERAGNSMLCVGWGVVAWRYRRMPFMDFQIAGVTNFTQFSYARCGQMPICQ